MRKKISIFLVAIILVGFVGCANFGIAFAEEATTYSGVLDDLQKDENFKLEDYPLVESDISLQVIQIAESMDKELFVYVYQPSGQFVATHINLAQTKEPTTADTHHYSLTLLNSSETLFKYKVEGITLLDDVVRYYDISSIFRVWNEWVDGKKDNDNVTDFKVIEVGQLWKAVATEDGLVYSMTTVETIEILNPYVNYVTYTNGFGGVMGDNAHLCHSHYVAFSTDKQMDVLLSASVYYEIRHVTFTGIYGYGKWQARETVLSKDDVVVNESGKYLLYSSDYEFSRIVSTADFLVNTNLRDDVKTELASTEWILRFVETEYVSNMSAGSLGTLDYDEVANVTILRLEFETDGTTYNVGTVMNVITKPVEPPIEGVPGIDVDDVVDKVDDGVIGDIADNIADGIANQMDPILEWWESVKKWFNSASKWWDSVKKVIGDIFSWLKNVFSFGREHWQIFVVIAALILVGILCAVFKPVWTAVKYLFVALWYVITAPLQLIVFVIRKISEKKNQ